MVMLRNGTPRLRPPYAISTRLEPIGSWQFCTACWTLRAVNDALARLRGRGYSVRVWQDGHPSPLFTVRPGQDWEGQAWA